MVGPADTRKEISNVIEMVRNGEMDISVINDRCRRILFHKYLIGLDSVGKVSLEGLHKDVMEEADSLFRRLSS